MKKVHFLGIAGSATSAAAAIAQAQGFRVDGCDMANPFNEYTTTFEKSQLKQGHSKDHLQNVDILAITPAVLTTDPKNEELTEARKRGIEVISWQQFMGKYLHKGKFVIAVCGTHGKSTTTTMIGQMLEDAGLDPTVEVGAVNPKWGCNYRIGHSKYFVSEADEYNDNFLSISPDISVVTNIEMEHPEYFRDFQACKDSFENFLSQTNNTLVANISDPNVAEVVKYVMKATGIKSLDYSKSDFKLKLQIPGQYNLSNAAAAAHVGLLLGIELPVIQQSLNNFKGIRRRFEQVGSVNGSLLFSDYGHHPTEIKTTLEAARQKFPDKKITVIFQPHMFTRTKVLFDDFVNVFSQLPVDHTYITDIFASREEDRGVVNSKKLADAIKLQKVEYVDNWETIENDIKLHSGPKDIFFFVGAGDIDKIARQIAHS